jgi:hypothetical protein
MDDKDSKAMVEAFLKLPLLNKTPKDTILLILNKVRISIPLLFYY